MQIPMNAKVECKDGAAGHTAAIIFDPRTQQVTHVVVKGSGSLIGEYLVPVGEIDKSGQHAITLLWSLSQLADAPRFDRVIAVGGADGSDDGSDEGSDEGSDQSGSVLVGAAMTGAAMTGAAMYMPYAGIDLLDDTVAPPPAYVEIEQTPGSEMAVHLGAHVEAADGRVGTVDEFVIDRKSGAVTHIVLRHGHLWGKREILVPVHDIDHIKDDTVYLNLDKHAVAELPDQPNGG